MLVCRFAVIMAIVFVRVVVLLPVYSRKVAQAIVIVSIWDLTAVPPTSLSGMALLILGGCGGAGTENWDFRCFGPWASPWDPRKVRTICFKTLSFILTWSWRELTSDSTFPHVPCSSVSPGTSSIFSR